MIFIYFASVMYFTYFIFIYGLFANFVICIVLLLCIRAVVAKGERNRLFLNWEIDGSNSWGSFNFQVHTRISLANDEKIIVMKPARRILFHNPWKTWDVPNPHFVIKAEYDLNLLIRSDPSPVVERILSSSYSYTYIDQALNTILENP